MDIFRISLLMISLLAMSDARQEIDIAVLVPYDTRWYFAKPRVAPAIEIAIDHLYNTTELLSELDIRVRYANSRCAPEHGINEAFNMYLKDNVDVFFGPCCDYTAAPIARQIRFWNLPMVTAGAMAGDYGIMKESMYPLLTRVGANFNSVSRVIINVLKYFNWGKVKLLYNENGQSHLLDKYCRLATDGIHKGLEADKNITHDYFKFRDPSEIDLRYEVGNKYSVLVMCASAEHVREIMIMADQQNFNNGEYVFLNVDLFSSQSELEKPWFDPKDTDERNECARRAFEALMTINLRKPNSTEYQAFSRKVKEKAREKYGQSVFEDNEEVNSFVGDFYDAILLYAIALNETLAEGFEAKNGTAVTQRMRNRTFRGITGLVSMDEIGDRNADYSLLDMNPNDSIFQVIGNYFGNSKTFSQVPGKRIHWPGGWTTHPPDTPICGFDGSGCPPDEPIIPFYATVIIVLGSLILVISLIGFFLYGYLQGKKTTFDEKYWRVKWDDIDFGNKKKKRLQRHGSMISLNRRGSIGSDTSIAIHLNMAANKQIYTKMGYYEGNFIALKAIEKDNVNITKPLLKEFKRMRDLQNDHIARFIGVCIDSPNNYIITEYYKKGSLEDVLENEQLALDNIFKFSLMQDIVRGLAYLHSSEMKSHGNLKSSNCVVDSRFVLKITDFGIASLRQGEFDYDEEDSYKYYRGKLWTAPELLRSINSPMEGTQKGDIYSFAIICQEIAYREGVFYLEDQDLSPQEIIKKVEGGQRPYFRPCLQNLEKFIEGKNTSCELADMIKKCWAEDPFERPDSQSLKCIIRKINREGDSGNILDNLLTRMEVYANNLEDLVKERTADYQREKEKAENLLYMMLPQSVARQLMKGESVTAEKFESCTIYFSDIVGFTSLSAKSTPMQVVDLLNDLYTAFDSITDKYDCYKVETIGDAYMVVSGIPQRNGDLHARELARVSLGLLNAVKSFKIRHRPDDQLRIRIGIHTGSAVAGVVGLKMPRYCLFGDTVNTASRMESNGEAMRIHVSPFTKCLLDKFPSFRLELRGPVDMKGKGKIITWWLLGEENNKENPDFAPLQDYCF